MNVRDSAVPRTPQVESRLPHVGTTIFTVMSALALEHGAVNLGQGFPDFECDPKLVDAVDGGDAQRPQPVPADDRGAGAARADRGQGRGALRLSLRPGERGHGHRGRDRGDRYGGAGVFVGPADEAIVLDPCYDSYAPNIELAGGRAVHVPRATPSFAPDFDRIAAALGPKTKAIIINSPHNPSGTVWSADDMRRLAELLRPTDVVVISDEVYEHMVFDGEHQSAARFPELAARTVVVSSFGKTYHVTGWKIAYAVAPAPLSAEFRKVHQFNVFTVNTPMQHGIASYLADPSHHLALAAFYRAKRDRFRAGLAATRLKLMPCAGTYFQCVDYSAASDLGEDAFCRWLTSEVGVAAIPLSAFYPDGREQGIVRFASPRRTRRSTSRWRG